MSKITKRQKKFLKKFKCVRISSNKKYDDMTVDFKCKRNKNLVARLQSEAFNEDCTGVTAHYLIIYNKEMPVLYFALKAGSLFTPLEQNLQNIVNKMLSEPKKIVAEKIEIRDKYSELLNDVELEKNTYTFQVDHTYAGIELDMFCVNDNARDIWKDAKTFHTLGKTMFWSKIVPIFIKVKKWIGCQYCFLFAADTTKDESLVNYYAIELKFERMIDIGTSKPKYDFGCIPMLCAISDLEKHQKEFFNNFNLDDDILA